MKNCDILEIIIQIITAIIYLLTLLVIFKTHRKTINQNRGSTLTNCLQTYISISSLREEAITNNKERKANLYYRQLLDLSWMQFQLWQQELISNDTMKTWSFSKFHYVNTNEHIPLKDKNGDTFIVRYIDIFNSLVEHKYFASDPEFIDFMKEVHQGKIDSALETRNKNGILTIKVVAKIRD